jgi:hypothetical protein
VPNKSSTGVGMSDSGSTPSKPFCIGIKVLDELQQVSGHPLYEPSSILGANQRSHVRDTLMSSVQQSDNDAKSAAAIRMLESVDFATTNPGNLADNRLSDGDKTRGNIIPEDTQSIDDIGFSQEITDALRDHLGMSASERPEDITSPTISFASDVEEREEYASCAEECHLSQQELVTVLRIETKPRESNETGYTDSILLDFSGKLNFPSPSSFDTECRNRSYDDCTRTPVCTPIARHQDNAQAFDFRDFNERYPIRRTRAFFSSPTPESEVKEYSSGKVGNDRERECMPERRDDWLLSSRHKRLSKSYDSLLFTPLPVAKRTIKSKSEASTLDRLGLVETVRNRLPAHGSLFDTNEFSPIIGALPAGDVLEGDGSPAAVLIDSDPSLAMNGGYYSESLPEYSRGWAHYAVQLVHLIVLVMVGAEAVTEMNEIGRQHELAAVIAGYIL